MGTGTKLPDLALRRWKDIAGACLAWHQGGDPGEVIRDGFGWLDPMQRDLCAGLFRTYTTLRAESRERLVDLDPPFSTVFHPDGQAVVSAELVFGLDGGEMIKLRTGRTGAGGLD